MVYILIACCGDFVASLTTPCMLPLQGFGLSFFLTQNTSPKGSKYPKKKVLRIFVQVFVVQGLGKYMMIKYWDP